MIWDTGDRRVIPGSADSLVEAPEHEKLPDRLPAEILVDAESLFFPPAYSHSFYELA